MKTIIAHRGHHEMAKKIAENNSNTLRYLQIDSQDACRRILSSEGDMLRDQDVTYLGDFSKP